MAQYFVGSIIPVGFDYAPYGWALCQGQLMSISQNTALFALLGTYYGGDGKTTFALPNLQGRLCVNQGQGQGLSDYTIGQSGGAPTITLIGQQVPTHSHSVLAAKGSGNNASPNNTSIAETNVFAPYAQQNVTPMANGGLGGVYGAGNPHNNLMPYQVLNWIICLRGVFPQRP